MSNKINYKKLFQDIITLKYPDNRKDCVPLLEKEQLSEFDVVKLSNMLSDDNTKDRLKFNQAHKAYSKKTVEKILTYQAKNGLSNSDTAAFFKMSRNTIAKWKKQKTKFLIASS